MSLLYIPIHHGTNASNNTSRITKELSQTKSLEEIKKQDRERVEAVENKSDTYVQGHPSLPKESQQICRI